MKTTLGELFVQYHHNPNDDVARRIMDHLRAVDFESMPEDAVVMMRTQSSPRILRLCGYMINQERSTSTMSDFACLADSIGLLSDEDVDELLPLYGPADRDGLRRQRIRRMVLAGRFDDAHAIAEQMGIPLQGHRDVAYHLAELGDHRNFFAEWPRYEPRRATKDLVKLRERLMVGVGRREGALAALELAKSHKRLGERYYPTALRSGQIAPYDSLVPLLEGELAEYLDQPDRCTLLVDQLLREVPKNPETEDPRVLELAERIGSLDGDKPVRQQRDGLLFRLWPIIGEASTLARVRALVRTPSYRRELMQLARETARPTEEYDHEQWGRESKSRTQVETLAHLRAAQEAREP